MKRYFIIPAVLIILSCKKEGTSLNMTESESTSEFRSGSNYSKKMPESMRAEELIVFVEDEANPFSAKKKIGDIAYSVQYKPHDYIIALENISKPLSAKNIESRRSEIKDMDYFTLRIKSDDFKGEMLRYRIQDGDEYYSRLQYYMSAMQKDVYLKCGKDSLPCLLYHFERTFGIAPDLVFSLGFERSATKAPDDRVFVFEDRIFGGGTIKINFNKEIFSDYPKLKAD
jgi:hypothetical protein